MAYRIDDDENRYQDLKDKVDQLEIQTFSPEVVARNQSTRNTGLQTGDGVVANPYPLRPPIRDFGSLGLGNMSIDLARVDAQYSKVEVTGTLGIVFNNPPYLLDSPTTIKRPRLIKFTVDITQDGTGGHAVTFTRIISPTPSVDTGAGKRTILEFQTIETSNDPLNVTFQLLSTLVI